MSITKDVDCFNTATEIYQPLSTITQTNDKDFSEIAPFTQLETKGITKPDQTKKPCHNRSNKIITFNSELIETLTDDVNQHAIDIMDITSTNITSSVVQRVSEPLIPVCDQNLTDIVNTRNYYDKTKGDQHLVSIPNDGISKPKLPAEELEGNKKSRNGKITC